ncbi:MAG TPA: glycosyltransferase [Armatimonadota bacterium]|nr:glycosyltransferase [Armatimonadota bacterium]
MSDRIGLAARICGYMRSLMSSHPQLRPEYAARQPLRIVHVDSGRHWRGSQHQIIYTMEGQIDRGHDVMVACPPGSPLARHATDLNFQVAEIPMRGEFDLTAIPRLANALRSFAPQVVHLQSAHAHVLGGAAARIAGVPAVILSRRLDNPIKGRIARWKYKHLYDRMISVSDGVKDVLVDAGVASDLITTIRSSVPISYWRDDGDGERIRREFGLDASNRLITTIAHVERRKGIDTLIDAVPRILEQVHEARVLIIGGGSHRQSIVNRVTAMGLDGKVILPGFRTDIPDILAASNVVVSPSYLEGCCNSLLEAMAAGKPVIGTKVGGTPEIIEHWVTGLLIPPKDPEALAWAVVRLLKDDNLSAQFGEAGRRVVREEFSVDRMVDETLRIYYQALEQRLSSNRPKLRLIQKRVTRGPGRAPLS